MKKSTIWLLTILMAVTFIGLLYIEIRYMEDMLRMRDEQFSDGVKRSLIGTAQDLIQDELQYINDNNDDTDDNIADAPVTTSSPDKLRGMKLSGNPDDDGEVIVEVVDNAAQDNRRAYRREARRLAAARPVKERADSATIVKYLSQQLKKNGIDIPFEFAVVNRTGTPFYSTQGFPKVEPGDDNTMFVQRLFPADRESKSLYLKVYFPTKERYILKSLRILIPAFAFTLVLLIVFVYTIILAFRQKRLNEMKSDFINNMTHEFKTPISTISLAAQMLNDDSVRKSPDMLRHVSGIINDETKRLRFQVEKVLQMSMFDRKKATLRTQDVDANAAISNIVNTFKLKVERYGGSLTADFDAQDAIVCVDEMHFTNVIFNLLDNAFKYRREDVPLKLRVSTADISGDRLRITVEDNGIGIRRDNLKKIFDKFYRVSTGNKHDVKGFGLGLAYVYKMLTLMGGTIKVESEPSHGSKFIIILPLTKN